MINYLLSFFRERRHRVRRDVSLQQARCMLTRATEDFSSTITLTPERVKELLRKAHK